MYAECMLNENKTSANVNEMCFLVEWPPPLKSSLKRRTDSSRKIFLQKVG